MLERQSAGLAQGWPAGGQGLRSRSRPHISEHPHPLARFQGPRLPPTHTLGTAASRTQPEVAQEFWLAQPHTPTSAERHEEGHVFRALPPLPCPRPARLNADPRGCCPAWVSPRKLPATALQPLQRLPLSLQPRRPAPRLPLLPKRPSQGGGLCSGPVMCHVRLIPVFPSSPLHPLDPMEVLPYPGILRTI